MTRAACGTLAALSPLAPGCSPQVRPPLRVGAIVWPGFECLFLARSLGLFDRLPIKLVEYSATPEAVRAFKNGAIEVISLTGDEYLHLAADEPDLKAFLIADFSNGADALVAQPEFGGLRLLAGKRIGVEVNTTGVMILTRALASAGMTPRDIQVVPLGNDRHLEAFAGREVEAVVTFEPRLTLLLQRGGKVLFDSSSLPGQQPDLFIARAETLESRLDLLRDLVRVWFAARGRMLQFPLPSAGLVAPREGLSPAEFAATLKRLSFPSLEENRRLLGAGAGELVHNLTAMCELLPGTGARPAARPGASLFTTAALP